jgi:steroid delta-isomerase
MPDAPSPEAIVATIEQYCARFSAGDRDGWLALWGDDATMEDPVGSPVRHGRDAIAEFYDSSVGGADSVTLTVDGDPIVCGDQAAFRFEIRPVLGGTPFSVHAIDVMTFEAADDGTARITSQRAFVDLTKLVPAE